MNFVKTLAGSELRQEVNKAIASFTDNHSEFTAYDVTAKVRLAVGPTVEVIHNKVRTLVHDIMAGSFNYEEYLKSLSNGLQARAYRSTVAGVCNPAKPVPGPSYTVAQGKGSGSLPTNLPVGIIGVTQPQSINKGAVLDTLTPKSEGRVTVPAHLLKLIGVKPGQFVYVARVAPDKLFVSKQLPLSPSNTFTADKHGSFRLRKHFVKNYTKFEFVQVGKNLEVLCK